MDILNSLIRILSRRNPHVIKDKVLILLAEQGGMEVTKIWSTLSDFGRDKSFRSDGYIDLICQEMSNEGFVSFMSIEGGYGLAVILEKGKVFLHWEGGYTSKLKFIMLNNFWTIVKIIAGVLNALAIIYLTYQSVKISDKTNKLEVEKDAAVKAADKYRSKNDSIREVQLKTNKIDSLNTLTKIRSQSNSLKKTSKNK